MHPHEIGSENPSKGEQINGTNNDSANRSPCEAGEKSEKRVVQLRHCPR